MAATMRIRERLDLGLEIIMAALMAAICVVGFLGVVFRYGLRDPLTWAEEIARLCLVWITFIGTYLAYRRRLHISIDVIRNRMSPRTQRVIHAVVTVLVLVLMGALALQGSVYSRAFLGSATPLLSIPLGVVYAALPFSAALLFFAVLVDLIDLMRGRTPSNQTPKADLL